MSCFIPYRRQSWECWVSGGECDFFGDGSCIGLWKFEDDFVDTCGIHPTAPLDGNPQFTDGLIGRCLYGEMYNSWHVQAQNFTSSIPITQTFWCKTTSSAEVTLNRIRHYDLGGSPWETKSILKATTSEYIYYVNPRSDQVYLLNVSLPNAFSWYFCCNILEVFRARTYVFDEAGNLVGSNQQFFDTIQYPQLDPNQLIAMYELANGPPEGTSYIDRVRMFKRALTQDECHRLCVEER